jgi:2-polyprenyl-3-methyl-5-hydroxy-6-metoxy-1,4-benzoquinol methylase
MIFEDTLIYDKLNIGNFKDIPAEPLKILEWAGHNKTILEVGCHTGFLSKWLQLQNCDVTGIDINDKATKIAAQFQVKTICCDIEKHEIWEQLQNKKFDVIILNHVLEHLVNPWKTLQQLTSYLRPGGTIIIGLPNICNAKNRFTIFFGRFDYEEIGVMDKTHLRFFNQKTARKLIETSGLEITEYCSSWQVNPLREFLDHTYFWFLKKLFSGHSPKYFKFSSNLTDVVMLFKCSIK